MDFAALDTGIALFNQRRYFEAHEIWEAAWLRADGQDKLFLQFLIQAAAALLHVERGNYGGAKSVWAKARVKRALLPAQFLGINLEEFTFCIEAVMTQARMTAPPPTLRRDLSKTAL